jgi:hypothetical protein
MHAQDLRYNGMVNNGIDEARGPRRGETSMNRLLVSAILTKWIGLMVLGQDVEAGDGLALRTARSDRTPRLQYGR